MTFAVVIPMYNASSTIIATINSCLNQSHKPTQIIVVDDCSTDDSVQKVSTAFGDKITLLKQSANLGPSAARNKGWNACNAQYIAFVDSDDTWHPFKLEIAAAIFNQNKNIDLLWHPYQSATLPTYDIKQMWTMVKATSLLSLLKSNPVSSSAIIFKRDIKERFLENMRYCEDYELALRMAYKYQVYKSPLLLTQIGRPLLSEGGLSGHLTKMRKGEIQSYCKLFHLNPLFIFFIPLLIIWSGIKHMRLMLFRK